MSKQTKRQASANKELAKEKVDIRKRRLEDKTNQEMLKDEQFFNIAIATFLRGLSTRGEHPLLEVMRDYKEALLSGNVELRELMMNIFYTAKVVQGKKTVLEGERSVPRVQLTEDEAKNLRRRQYIINEELKKHGDTYFNFNLYTQFLNKKLVRQYKGSAAAEEE